jgi:hypothetical protein
MESLVFRATAVLLVGGWLYAELFVRRRAARGTLVRALDADGPGAWLQTAWLVRTDAGALVEARAQGCVQCQGGLRPGRRVGLLRERGGFVVALSERPCDGPRCGEGA